MGGHWMFHVSFLRMRQLTSFVWEKGWDKSCNQALKLIKDQNSLYHVCALYKIALNSKETELKAKGRLKNEVQMLNYFD